MAPTAAQSLVTERRLELAGKPGIRGLLSNMRTLSIAVFASLGGLVYGYNQGQSPLRLHTLSKKSHFDP